MKTKSLEQVLEESSPAVKKAYKNELKKVSKKKVSKYKSSWVANICANCDHHLFDHGSKNEICPKVTKTTGLPTGGIKLPKDWGKVKAKEDSMFDHAKNSRFADKDFSRFAPEDTYTATENYKKHTNFLGEIEGEPTINCDKWTAMCVVLVLLCLVAYAMHGDYQAVQSNLIH